MESLSMHITIKPHESIRDHVIRLHDADKSESGATSSIQKYMPSKEEIMKIAKLVEKITGMKVSESFKKGEIKVKFVNRDEAVKITQEETYSVFKKFIDNPDILEQLRQKIIEEVGHSENVPGFFSPSHNTVYIINDSLEEIVKKQCAIKSIRPESEEGRRIEKFFILSTVAHEHIHQTTKENKPSVGNWRLNSLVEQAKIISEFSEVEHKDPERAKILLQSLHLCADKMDALYAYNEAIAYYTGYEVMYKLGYSHSAMKQLTMAKEDTEYNPLVSKGIRFLEAIEKKTKQNPIAFTIRNPPQSMQEIENPEKYLIRVK